MLAQIKQSSRAILPDPEAGPLPLNIDRGMNKLVFERYREMVKEELRSPSTRMDAQNGYELCHCLPICSEFKIKRKPLSRLTLYIVAFASYMRAVNS